MAPLSTLSLHSPWKGGFSARSVGSGLHTKGVSTAGEGLRPQDRPLRPRGCQGLTSAQSLQVFPSAMSFPRRAAQAERGGRPIRAPGGGWPCAGWHRAGSRGHTSSGRGTRGAEPPELARGPEPWMPMPRPAPRAGSPCASGVWNPSVENRGAQGGCWGHLKTADSVGGIKGQTRARGWSAPWLGCPSVARGPAGTGSPLPRGVSGPRRWTRVAADVPARPAASPRASGSPECSVPGSDMVTSRDVAGGVSGGTARPRGPETWGRLTRALGIAWLTERN